MAIPTIIWTALPNGFVDISGRNVPRLSLSVSFRLEDAAATTLGSYFTANSIPTGLGNWPATVQTMADAGVLYFDFELATAGPLIATIDTSNLRPDVWDLLFGPNTFVRTHSFQDHAARRLRSYSTRTLAKYIDKLYTSVANASPTDYPDLRTGRLNDLVSTWGTAISRLRRRAPQGLREATLLLPPVTPASVGEGPHPDQAIEAEMQTIASGASSNVPLAEMFRAYRFYNRGQVDAYRRQHEPVIEADVPPHPSEPAFDFHEVMALLGDHPMLLRMLGLSIDCTVVGATGALPATGRVRSYFDWTAAGLAGSPFSDERPWTAFQINSAGFLPRPKAGSLDVADGMLQLGNTKVFDVRQEDVDGSALKTIDYASNMAVVLARLLAAPEPNQCAPETPPETSPTQSLPALRNSGITVFRDSRDEALYDRLLDMRAHNSAPSGTTLYADDVTRGYCVDVLYRGRWKSLCERQGTYVVSNPAGTQSVELASEPGDEGYVKAVSGSSTGVDAPGSPGSGDDLYVHEALFGWDNWSLAVPLPGRSVTHDRFEGDSMASYGWRRNEPNPDFAVDVQLKVLPGSLPPLRYGERYAVRARTTDLVGNRHPLEVDTTVLGGLWESPTLPYLRHDPVTQPVLLLRAPLREGEGMEHLVVRTQTGPMMIEGAADIFNETCERHVAPPKVPLRQAELHGMLDALFSDPPTAYAIAAREKGSFQDPGPELELIDKTGASVSTDPLKDRGEPLPEGHYVIHPKSAVTLPYLPDPLSDGLALDQLPSGQIEIRTFGGTWPDIEPFRLVLQANTGANLKITDGSGTYTLAIPKATILRLRYSSATTAKGRSLLYRYNAMSAAAQTATEARMGQHWMLSPYRELVIVHAVERPMKDPLLEPMPSISRSLGANFASLRGKILSHSRSTGQVEIFARYSETVDLMGEPGPRVVDREGRVCERVIGYDEEEALYPRGDCNEKANHEFGDTKHRWVRYYGLGTTRYREYFPRTLWEQPELITREGPETDEINIPSSARPDAPKLLYILPTFRFEESEGKSVRRGQSLRVYVDRPWYSSGDDELLGLVLQPAMASASDLKQIKPYMSEWGSDPVWEEIGPSEPLQPQHFVSDPQDAASMPTVGHGLSLVELPENSSAKVSVAGFTPQYNEERGAYYFDIQFDPGKAHYTFVRLALARYQPYSLNDVHLSRVVRAEFAQLMADRTATLQYDDDAAVEVSISGVAPRNALGVGLPVQASVVASPVPPPTKVSTVDSSQLEVGGATRGTPQVAPTPVLAKVSLFKENPSAGAGRIVRAHIERLDNPASEELGWNAVDAGVQLPSYTTFALTGEVFWRGRINLPQSYRDGTKEHRLVVREFELFETDGDVAEAGIFVYNPEHIPMRARLVYLDTLPLKPM